MTLFQTVFILEKLLMVDWHIAHLRNRAPFDNGRNTVDKNYRDNGK